MIYNKSNTKTILFSQVKKQKLFQLLSITYSKFGSLIIIFDLKAI